MSHTSDKRNARTRRLAARARGAVHADNLHRQQVNRLAARKPRGGNGQYADPEREKAAIVGRMTNWQWNQFMRRCEGNYQHVAVSEVLAFAGTEHASRVLVTRDAVVV